MSMGSKEAEELCNTETEEGTVALQKKRSRRVSFAEITSVHVFDRDEDYETPPDPKPSSENAELGQENVALGFHRDSADSDDSKDLSHNEEEDDDDVDERKSFLRPIESPSPGSTIGSATSNDEDNFFGPVSASFIRPGRLSESAASDENHDITMDSTAFSMHFRSLARSDSGGDFKTPTGVRLAFEEKTPTLNTTPTNPGSFMVLTGAKKQIPQSPGLVDKISVGNDSNDMSLVGENPHRYDYGRLSPGLDALLAEGNKELHADSVSDHINILKSSSFLNKGSKFSTLEENGSGLMDLNDYGDTEPSNTVTHDASAGAVSVVHSKLGEENNDSTTPPIVQITNDFSSNKNDFPAADASIDHQIRTPNQLIKGIKDALETGRPKLGFSSVNSGSLSNMDDKVLQLDSFTQHESGYLRSTESWIKENYPQDGRHKSDIDQNSDKRYGSPLAGSISSLSAKRRQIFLDTANSSKHQWIVTPQKQPDSLLNKESIIHGESVSSIQKSVSKFKILEASPYASNLKDGIGNAKLRSSDYLSMAPLFDTVLEENSKRREHKHGDAPIAHLEEHLLSFDMKNGEHKSKDNMDSNGIDTPKNIENSSQTEETTGLVKDKESLNQMPIGNFCKEKPSKLMDTVGSPSQFSWSGKKVLQHLLTSENPTEGVLVTSGIDSSLMDVTLDYQKDKKATDTPDKFVSSPVKRLEKKSASPEYQGSLSRDLKQQDQYNKLVSSGPGQDGDSNEGTEKLDSFFAERRAQSSLPFMEINHLKDFVQMKRINDRETNPHDLQNEPGTFGNFQTPSRERDTLNFQSGSPDRNLQTGTDPTRFRKEFSQGGLKVSSYGSASPYVRRSSTNEPPLQSLVEWITQSPYRKGRGNASHNDNIHLFVGKDVLSPKSNQFTNGHGNHDFHQGLHILNKPSSIQDIENTSGRKRRSEEIVPGDRDRVDEISRIQRSPKVHKGGDHDLEFLLERTNESNSETKKIGGDTRLRHWADISSKFSGDTKQLLSPLIDKLNLQAIGELEDILVHLQKVKTYEMLCSEIQSQKIVDHVSNVRHKRVAETRLFLYKMAYEQAKLQLMCVKREKLLKRVQLLSSGIQESRMLKLNYFQHLSVPGAKDAQVDDSHPHSCSVACDKVTTMREEYEASDRKIKKLIKSFHTSCKMKGEPTSADTIVLVNDHLKKRMCCRFIRQDLQVWEVDDLESRNGHHNVVLNYRGFISQRFTVHAGPVSSIIISNKLNDMNIVKNFPHMDACTAFAFVLNAETTRKYVGPRSLAQETQITSSLLCNLLDVVEEVQRAREELRNLTLTSFHSPSVEQLDLQLCFIDFKSSRKVALTLDMTSLKCGVYPSEILPSQLQAPAAGAQNSLPQSVSAEIRAAVKSLRVGYLRIIRLCRCVSQVVQASSM